MKDELEDRDSAQCSGCGKADYRKHLLYRGGKPYCDDCAEAIGLTEANQDGAASRTATEKTTMHGRCGDCGQGAIEPVHDQFALYVDDSGTERFWYCTYCGSNHVTITDEEGNPIIEQGDLYQLGGAA
jgi:hypothetical protein